MLRFFIMQPLLESNGFSLQMSNFLFFLLVFSTVLLAAAGYIINDVYDIDTDKINRPDKVIVGKSISIRAAENLYLILNTVAVGIGIYISFVIGLRFISLAFLLVAGLLYFYSTVYKSQFLLGNLIVAFFAALVPLMVMLFEGALLKVKFKFFEGSLSYYNYLIGWIGFYATFAFLISFAREIIKDMQDIKGDAQLGQKTLPVTFGLKVSKYIVLIILTLTSIIVFYILVCYLHDPVSLAYIVPLVLSPILYTGWVIFKASEKKDFERASTLCKLIMLTGIMYTLLARYILFGYL